MFYLHFILLITKKNKVDLLHLFHTVVNNDYVFIFQYSVAQSCHRPSLVTLSTTSATMCSMLPVVCGASMGMNSVAAVCASVRMMALGQGRMQSVSVRALLNWHLCCL